MRRRLCALSIASFAASACFYGEKTLAPEATGRGIGAIRLGESADFGADHFPDYEVVILAAHRTDALEKIKEAGASTKVIVYIGAGDLYDLGIGATEPDEDERVLSTGVTYNEALAHDAASDEPWVLRDANDEAIAVDGAPYLFLGDPGVPSFQQRWYENVKGKLVAQDWDGIYIYDVVAQPRETTSVKYPNDDLYEDAMFSFISSVGPKLMADGFYVGGSAYKFRNGDPGSNDGSTCAGWWKAVGPHVSALAMSYWMQSPTDLTHLRSDGTAWSDSWAGWQSLAAIAQSNGNDFLGLTEGTSSDVRVMRYGKASFLLDWNGGGGAFIFNPQEPGADPWHEAWTKDLGSPRGERQQVGAAYKRAFQRGTVYVNPSEAPVVIDGVQIPAVDAVIR